MHPTPPAAPVGGSSVRWGYAGVFPGEFGVYDADPLVTFEKKLRFVASHGFGSTGLGLNALADPATRAAAERVCGETGLGLSVHPHLEFFAPDAGIALAQARAAVESLRALRSALPLVGVTCGAGPVHRFMREPSLDFQLGRLAAALVPLAEGCRELGLPVGIENHCDYYVSELVELCGRVPGLGIFLDTGNCFMVGEKPLPAAREAAPLVMGTHFKDHVVVPDEKELKFVVKGSPLGEGDVPLREIFAAIRAAQPDLSKLVLQVELVPGKSVDGLEALRRSVAFLNSLS